MRRVQTLMLFEWAGVKRSVVIVLFVWNGGGDNALGINCKNHLSNLSCPFFFFFFYILVGVFLQTAGILFYIFWFCTHQFNFWTSRWTHRNPDSVWNVPFRTSNLFEPKLSKKSLKSEVLCQNCHKEMMPINITYCNPFSGQRDNSTCSKSATIILVMCYQYHSLLWKIIIKNKCILNTVIIKLPYPASIKDDSAAILFPFGFLQII